MLSPKSGKCWPDTWENTVFLKVLGGRKRGKYVNLLSRQASTVLAELHFWLRGKTQGEPARSKHLQNTWWKNTVFLKVLGGCKRGKYVNLLSRQASTVLAELDFWFSVNPTKTVFSIVLNGF